MNSSHTVSNSPLGKQSSYTSAYTPSLLFPISRKQNRENLGLNDSPVPFHGVDLWTGYELSWLNPKGKPQVAIANFYFSSDSASLIESKSFKLYLNSFNQSCFESYDQVKKILETDLGAMAEGSVVVELFSPSQFNEQKLEPFRGICLDQLDIETHTYEVEPAFLKSTLPLKEESLFSDLLKSNCLVTGQPDWGSIFIHYKGPQIDHEGLLKYIISFRNHQGFHEQCVERIFCDILHQCKPTCLTVYARYARRGGLDINPFRSNFEQLSHATRNPRQ